MKRELINLVYDPKNPLLNFKVGKLYDDMGQLSSAVSYYLRAAEFGQEDLLSYESLLKISNCFIKQGNRLHTCKAALLRAISLMPKRPEAYFLLSKVYEAMKEWHDCYSISCIGESLSFENLSQLKTNIDYPGKYGLTFQRGVSAWWVGLFDESIAIFRELLQRNDIEYQYIQASINNLNNLGEVFKRLISYEKDNYSDLICKFPGAENIEKNYSQVYQDMFILSMLNGKRNGTFIEIGCCDPFFNSNTALLEKQFEWNGISIDIDSNEIKKYEGVRKTKTLLADATKIDYNELLTETSYDYLQIDCEPAATTYRILEKIPLNKCKFAIITYEHDKYIDEDKQYQEKARKYLESYGYVRVVNNISEDKWSSFEDWYVHPDLVNKNIINKMMCISDDVKRADLYMLGKL